MRKKVNLDARMERVKEFIVSNPHSAKQHWSDMSGGRPLHLEIGCGKGRFAVGTALRNPDIFLIAIEMEPNALVVAAEAAAAADLRNLRLMNLDAAELEACFQSCALERIYLNFSDPWPHNRSRRLTHPRLLSVYRRLLREGGDLLFKTDNSKLFEWSLEQFVGCGWRLEGVTRDLHGGAAVGETHPVGGVVTEYEQRFSSQGVAINRLAAFPPTGGRELSTTLSIVSTEQDVAELCSLARRLWREHYTPIIGKMQVAYMVERFQSVEAVTAQIADGYVYKLLRADGDAAGYIAVKPEGERLFLSKLYIDRRFRGHGLSRMMIDDCVAQFPKARVVYLTCNKHNTATLAAYERLGFVQTDSVVTDIGNGYVMDDHVLERRLD